jgi:hypothetical protein
MLKKALKIKKEYDQAKFAAVEHVINNFESRNSKIIVTILFIGICLEWVYAVFSSNGLEKTSETYGNAPFAFPFLTSYFFFFLGSKLMFKPTEEELSDDTSLFAIFSACDRRSRRSLVSIFLSIFHTLIFVFYLISKDLK